jgi:hypothetical protein
MQVFFILLLSLYIGGASESYAIIFMMILFISGIYRWLLQRRKLSDDINQKILIALFLIAVSFSFAAFAPGTAIRHSLLPDSTLSEKIWVVIKSFVKFFIRYLPTHGAFLLLFSFPWMYIGIYLNESRDTVVPKYLFRNITCVFIALLIVMIAPTAIIMSETGPDRALSIISLATAAYFAFACFCLGNYFSERIKGRTFILIIYSLTAIAFLAFNIHKQKIIADRFTIAYNERMKIIDSHLTSGNKGELELPALPESGMLYWDELSTDTSYFTNVHLKKGLNLPFQVKLKQTEK